MKTATRTFRVDQAALETIERDAAAKKITANTLVNQLLLAYAQYDRYLEQFPMLKILSPTFGLLLEGVSDDYAKALGRRVAQNIVLSAVVSRSGTFNLETLIEHFKLVSEYSKIFTYREAERSGRRSISLYHRFGPKGSVYFAGYLSALFEMLEMRSKITATDTAVTAKV